MYVLDSYLIRATIEQWDNATTDTSRYFQEANVGCIKLWEATQQFMDACLMPMLQEIGLVAPS